MKVSSDFRDSWIVEIEILTDKIVAHRKINLELLKLI
jgi:hypothetical protein